MTRLTHDPESGCRRCPLRDYGLCRAAGRTLPSPWSPAPDWCPLRRGPVTVGAPVAVCWCGYGNGIDRHLEGCPRGGERG